MTALKLGLLADNSIQLSHLETIVASSHFVVAASVLARQENLMEWPDVDVWVVSMNVDSNNSRDFIEHLDGLSVPVIYDEVDSYASLDIDECAKRFSKKIDSCVVVPLSQDKNLKKAKNVWVLAASAGGPEAVCEFIKNIPDPIDNMALVYVQHMDEFMSEAITKSLQRQSNWDVVYVTKPQGIYEKTIYIISPSSQIEIDEGGNLNPTSTPWPGCYKPSVDHVVAKVWRRYKKDSGVIVFSGMGDDGAKTCHMIKNAGGQVWVQTLETCAVDSMPKEVLNTQCVSYRGSPAQLAKHFIYYQNKNA